MLLALSAGFVIKIPLFPFHTWLPLAHTEAPTAGSVLLAGVLLKLGTYGFLRLCLPLLPVAVAGIGVPIYGTMAVIGIVYGALGALAQSDIKKLVAYSSVSHLGFCVLGIFALNSEGITGGVMQMINHGLSTGALFLLVGMVYDRYHTRELSELGGLATRLPLLVVGDGEFIDAARPVLKSLAKLSDVRVFALEAEWVTAAEAAPVAVVGEARICLHMEVDAAAEKARLTREAARLEGELVKVQTKLANETFVAKVPPAVLEQERKRLTEFTATLEKIREQLARLK